MSKKILIADDDHRIVKALSVRLKARGYEIISAYDGVGAIKTAVEKSPDLIILDVSMPAGSGIHVAETLRGNSQACNIPIIFMTAKTNPEYFTKAMENSAIAFLTKPFEDNALVAMVDTALGTPA